MSHPGSSGEPHSQEYLVSTNWPCSRRNDTKLGEKGKESSWKNDQNTLKKILKELAKKVSLKVTDVQRLLETLSYRNKPPVHSNKQCAKESEILFEKKNS